MTLLGRWSGRGEAGPPATSERFVTDERLGRILAAYGGQRQPPLSYATARDYADSADVIGDLARANRDMKDVQRCWVLKAILGCVPPGSRLIEIGAGEPLIADVLARAGYDVTVVDPYEGLGTGMTEPGFLFDTYRRIRFRREPFGDLLAGLDPGSVDCCYSVSVLEHMQPADLEAALRGIQRFSRPGAPTVHSVDHVILGQGAMFHWELIKRLGSFFGRAGEALAVVEMASDDPDAYLLSIEAHNGWRGGRPYDGFPMRRCISVQFCDVPAGHLPP